MGRSWWVSSLLEATRTLQVQGSSRGPWCVVEHLPKFCLVRFLFFLPIGSLRGAGSKSNFLMKSDYNRGSKLSSFCSDLVKTRPFFV